MLPMLPSLRRAWEESEAVTDSVPVPSRKGAGKLWNHLRNGASRTQYLEASDTEPAGTCSSMNTVTDGMTICDAPLPACQPAFDHQKKTQQKGKGKATVPPTQPSAQFNQPSHSSTSNHSAQTPSAASTAPSQSHGINTHTHPLPSSVGHVLYVPQHSINPLHGLPISYHQFPVTGSEYYRSVLAPSPSMISYLPHSSGMLQYYSYHRESWSCNSLP